MNNQEQIIDIGEQINNFKEQYELGYLIATMDDCKYYYLFRRTDNEQFLVKIIEKKTIQKQRSYEKLKQEIEIQKTLNHQNILKLYQVFEDKENIYLLLEQCSKNLLCLLQEKKRLSEKEVQVYISHIINALLYIHKQKIIHRDLKLNNIFINPNIKIAQFNYSAKIEFQGQRRQTICGSSCTIAPEILDNQNGHSYEVDIWNLGIITYQLLVGVNPFDTGDVKSNYQKIKLNDYSFPNNIVISNEAKDFINQMLQTNPDQRSNLQDLSQHPFIKEVYQQLQIEQN